MIGVVVADPRAHLGRWQQAAGVVVADVAYRHSDLGGELLDRELVARHTSVACRRARLGCRSDPARASRSDPAPAGRGDAAARGAAAPAGRAPAG